MEGRHRRFGSLGKPNDFAKCIVGRPLARFSWRQGSIPANFGAERTIHCIFKYGKHVFQCEDADGIIVEPQHPKTDSNKLASIGYWLDQHYQGKGIITKSCKALIHYGFTTLHLNRIEIRCGTENYKSQAIPESLHLKKEVLPQTLDSERQVLSVSRVRPQ